MLIAAAHAMCNFWGQGANTSIEDGIVLARALAATDSIEEGLQLYDRTRLLRTEILQVTSADPTPDSPEPFMDWIYGYDAANTPLEPSGEEFAHLIAA